MIDDTQKFTAEEDVEQERPTLESFVERDVNVQREVAVLKDDLADIAGQAKELFGISKRDFNALVKYSFEEDVDADIAELEAIRTKLNNLGENPQEGDSQESCQGELFGEDE